MTWRYETHRGSPAARRPGERGIALIATLVVMVIVAAIGLGLVVTASLEPMAAANIEAAWDAAFAAEAGIAIAAHELAGLSDWDLALASGAGSSILESSGPSVELPDGSLRSLDELTNLAMCGHAGPCSAAEATAFTVVHPWGPNNPRWRVYGHGRLDRLLPGNAAGLPVSVVVWVGDDPAEIDGDPLHDTLPGPGGAWQLGACVLALRAEAFAGRGGHRALVATITRPGPDCAAGARLVSLRVEAGTP